MNDNITPHIHAEVIKAWADGYKIEGRTKGIGKDWELKDCPLWVEDWEYRIYDSLREVKEAFERGKICQAKNKNSINAKWIDFTKFDSIYRGLGNLWAGSSEWRIKPEEEFKVGDWVIHVINKEVYKITNEKIGFKKTSMNLGHIKYVNSYKYIFRKATKQEVINAPNYDGTATNEDFPFEIGDYLKSKIKSNKHTTKIFRVKDKKHLDFLNNNSNYSFCYATEKEIEEFKREIKNKIPDKLKEVPLTPEECYKIYNLNDYEPFTWEDRELLRGKWIRKQYERYMSDEEVLITEMYYNDDEESFHIVCGRTCIKSKTLFKEWEFVDGTPCGKLKI